VGIARLVDCAHHPLNLPSVWQRRAQRAPDRLHRHLRLPCRVRSLPFLGPIGLYGLSNQRHCFRSGLFRIFFVRKGSFRLALPHVASLLLSQLTHQSLGLSRLPCSLQVVTSWGYAYASTAGDLAGTVVIASLPSPPSLALPATLACGIKANHSSILLPPSHSYL
jgi:hypothetical protein